MLNIVGSALFCHILLQRECQEKSGKEEKTVKASSNSSTKIKTIIQVALPPIFKQEFFLMLKNQTTYGRFRFGIVNDANMLKDTFRMRFQVYAEEFGFEKIEDHPGGLETDEYEKDSVHCACLNEQDAVVGTIRLVFDSNKGFPIEHAVPETTFVGEKPDRSKIAEISRLAMSKNLSQRQEDGRYDVESCRTQNEGGILVDKPDRSKFAEISRLTVCKGFRGKKKNVIYPDKFQKRKNPIIMQGLYAIIYQESRRRGITHWYMITEKKLYYALKRYGVLFHQIGAPVWYHGERTPYLGIIDQIEQNLIKKNPAMMKNMLIGLEKEYHPSFSNEDKLRLLSDEGGLIRQRSLNHQMDCGR